MWEKDAIEKQLRASGHRMTRQREEILDVILAGEGSSCKEIYCEVHRRRPAVGVATVYRTIALLEEIGVLSRQQNCVFCAEPNAAGGAEGGLIEKNSQ